MNKFVKSILVAAVLAIGLSACGRDAATVEKMQAEGVIDFQDGWKLYLPNTSDPQAGKLAREVGPTYVYSENGKNLFSYSCGSESNVMAVNSDIGTSIYYQAPGGVAVGRSDIGVFFGPGYRASLFSGIVKDITAPGAEKLININNTVRVTGEGSAEYQLANGYEFTQATVFDYRKHPKFLELYKFYLQSDISRSMDETGVKFNISDARPFKLPAIQNPGLYDRSICNFTWDKFDPSDIDEKEPVRALQLTDEEIDQSDLVVKALQPMIAFHKENVVGTYNKDGQEVTAIEWVNQDKTDYHNTFGTFCGRNQNHPRCVQAIKDCRAHAMKCGGFTESFNEECPDDPEKRDACYIYAEGFGPSANQTTSVTPMETEDIPAAHPQPNTEPEVKDPNFQVNNNGTVTRSYNGSYSQIYASKSARGDWAPAGNSDAAQGRSMYALCHVSGNQNACKRLENRCGKDEYVKTESDMYFCLGADEAETTGQ